MNVESKAKDLDQFFTKEHIAQECWDRTEGFIDTNGYKWVEPSCGDGMLYRCLPQGSLAFDLDPDSKLSVPECVIGNTLEQNLNDYVSSEQEVGVFMNPPFGKRSKLVVDFFNHFAQYPNVKVISMISPCTVEKFSIQRQLDMDFRLVQQTRLIEDAFLFQGKPYRVRCSHTIWLRTDKFLSIGGELSEEYLKLKQ